MLQKFKDLLDNTKAWFKHSETILLARIEAFTGLVIGGISAMDWSPLLNLGVDTAMSLKQGVYLGSIMFVKGIVTEWVRRRNTIEVDSKLIPTDIVKEVKTEVTTNLPTTVTTTTDTVKV
jgi:hypothetical protein